MTERIVHILPEQVASQIAAGEVVERPASAVKELIENSIDAGARNLAIEIERGGLGLISVTDDGCGMSREDAILSLRRHATSKIRSASDLVAIRTLGFRGEALASIASVAKMRMQTQRTGDAHGVELVLSGGDLEEERACAVAAGTRIEVRELFFNTPARLKFMKTVPTEQAAIAEVVQRLALANHAIAFRLAADGREMFSFPRANSALERVRQAFGGKLASQMLQFALSRNGLRVGGLATMSQESFATPRMIFSFVNGRAVRDKLLSRAVTNAYQTLMPRGRHPAVVLFLELRHEEVDVNVHPMKTEVRFRNSGAVFDAVYHALRDRLANQTGSVSISAAAQPTVDASASAAPVTPATVASIPLQPERPLRLIADGPAAPSRVDQRPLNLGFQRSPDATSNGAATMREAAVPMYSTLKILGQIFAGYIALEGDEGLLLVDQHAAHERVTFEKLRAEMRNGGIRTQALLTPATVEMNPARAAHIEAALPELRAMGFELEPFGPATLLLKATPAVFGVEGGAKLLSDMLDSMGENGLRASGEGALEEWLKQLACHGSVRVGRALEEREIRELLAELDRTQFKSNCPHGRPVHINFARGQIERMFRR
ncbi:MAG TPA: DNA mismatch repair endonuclease MutL [Candidatus Binataceae bacterium]|nr:DNA mismatch repair endonuclease MutL [Candidatus Binataceae bacterium]